MTTSPYEQSCDGAPAGAPFAPPASAPSRLRGLLAVHDAILLGYLVVVRLLVATAPASELSRSGARATELSLALLVVGIVVGRRLPGVPARVRSLVYRAACVGALASTYPPLRHILPLVRPDSLDALLLRADELLFAGTTPALWLERFNSRPVVEYFSFFYFSYYLVLAAYIAAMAFAARPSRRMTEFALGTFLVYCTGQLGYFLVPASGPCLYLADSFRAPLEGGLFWGLVWSAFEASSAVRDIFPSMHTCGPAWFALFALHQSRTCRRYRLPALVTGFIALNIVVSTVFLRWHYAVDVLAGLALAYGASRVVPRLVTWEERRRARAGLGPVWPGPSDGRSGDRRGGTRPRQISSPA